MFWEDIEPIISDRLSAAIASAYDAFDEYRLNGTITYCDCPVCMTAQTAQQLSSLPLDKIDAGLLAEYTNSAHGYGRGAIEHEFKHFLPRYLDLIGHCEMPCHLGAETCLQRLGDAAYRKQWPEQEVAAVDEFFSAFIEASCQQLLLIEWPVGLRLEFDIGEVLAMVAIAKGDLTAVLAILDSETLDPEAATHLASLRGDIETRAGVHVYKNAHLLRDHRDAAEQIGAFAMRESVTVRILKAIDLLDDKDYDGVLQIGLSAIPRRH